VRLPPRPPHPARSPDRSPHPCPSPPRGRGKEEEAASGRGGKRDCGLAARGKKKPAPLPGVPAGRPEAFPFGKSQTAQSSSLRHPPVPESRRLSRADPLTRRLGAALSPKGARERRRGRERERGKRDCGFGGGGKEEEAASGRGKNTIAVWG
jgi:hypothetical protein